MVDDCLAKQFFLRQCSISLGKNSSVSKRFSLHVYEPTELKVDNSNGSRHLQRRRESEKTKTRELFAAQKVYYTKDAQKSKSL